MIRIASPAKINLHLRVGPLGSDGFHPILSWICTTGLCDSMTLEARAEPGVILTCDRPDVPLDETNLIVRAARALDKNRGANVNLEKKIPMGGGLGGGSSNAAFALVGLNQLWELKLSKSRLAEIGATLGSDVPFFLHGPSSICAGRGERVTPMLIDRKHYVVLIFPQMSISTPAVYRQFDEMKLGSTSAIQDEPSWTAWTGLPARDLLKMLINDLEAPAFSVSPQLAELREAIEEKLDRTVRMSGSGSTLFTLADDMPEAERIAKQVRSTGTEAQAYRLAPD